MGLFTDIKAMSDVQKIKKGGIAKLSISQIVNLLINLPDAKRNLPEDRYLMVYATYKGMRECKIKIQMNMDVYLDTAIELIKKFDSIAPYEQYSGSGAFETSLMMADIFGENHQQIRNLRRQIADLEEELESQKTEYGKNLKILENAFTDDQLSRMVARGEFPASRVKEYVEVRNNLAMFLKSTPRTIAMIAEMIDGLKRDLAELENDS